MNKPIESWQSQLALLPLPVVVRTKDGVEFDPRAALWAFRTSNKSVSCNFDSLPPVTPVFLHGFKQMMISVAETQQGSGIQNTFSGMLRILRFVAAGHDMPIDSLSFEDLARFALQSVNSSDVLSKLKAFLKRWAKLGYHGVSSGLVSTFPPCRTKPPGQDVATQNPRKGPHDEQEFESILEAVNHALETDVIDLDRALEVRLCAMLGPRPAQMALLKCRDITRDEHGRVIVAMPLIKGKDQATRDEFRSFPLEPTTGDVLWDYSQDVCTAFASLMEDPHDAPLFPQIEQLNEYIFQVGLRYHPTAHLLSKRLLNTLSAAFDSYEATSVRLNGEPIASNARRLRKSFCQRGANEGIDQLTLAHLMGHRTTGSVAVYFTVTDRIRARFSKKIALQMAPLSNAFGAQLRILKDLSDATRPIPASRIPDLRLDQHGHLKWLASCASCGDCNQLRPYVCLSGCASFEPFLDADLEPILDRLISERDGRGQVSLQIAAIRDRAIYGCAQIMLRQRELRAQENSQ